MKNKLTLIIFIFISFFFFADNISAGALPDWNNIDFIWNGVEINEGGQYSFPLNEEKISEYGWPEGYTEYQEFYADIYKGTLHNGSLIKEHTLNASFPLPQTDSFSETGKYFIVIYTVEPFSCGTGFDVCISSYPNHKKIQTEWFEKRGTCYSSWWSWWSSSPSCPKHWGIINFEITEATDEPVTDPLLLKYEPILYLHPDENYKPMNADAFVEHSFLWDDNGIMDDILLKTGDASDPVTLDYIATSTNTSNWYLAFSDGANPKSINASAALVKYNELLLNGAATTTYYGYKTTDSYTDNDGQIYKFIVLQYWYFYAFNDWKEHNGFNNHEGDWETVMVFLDKDTEEPKYVAYSAHHNDGDPSFNLKQYDSVRRSWNIDEIDIEGDQVKSYVSLGSHANYPKNGSGIHQTGIKKDDLTSIEGNHLISSIWREKIGISLDLPKWIYFYEGKWGADKNDLFEESSGPQGPNFIDIGGTIRFQNPIKWAGIDKISKKTISEPTDTLLFNNQSTMMKFDNILNIGTTVLVDLHNEFISFGENLADITLLPNFWDITSSIINGTFSAEVSFNFNPDTIADFSLKVDDLSVFIFDEIANKWKALPSMIDTDNDTISFITSHFSRYAIGASNWKDITDNLKIKKELQKYNPKTNVRTAEVKIKTLHKEELSSDLRLIITNIDKEGVYMLNNTGTTTDGMPYIKIDAPLKKKKHIKILLEFQLPIKEEKTKEKHKKEDKSDTHKFKKFEFDVVVQKKLES